MPSEFFDFDITRSRLDVVRADELVGDLELRLDRISVDPEPGGESIVITKGCTKACTFGCSDARAGTCTCPCLPGDLGLTDW